ncbi:MAG: hypothetical protein DRP35_04700, partial [Candidatus Zixiibacteriota bacterium]
MDFDKMTLNYNYAGVEKFERSSFCIFNRKINCSDEKIIVEDPIANGKTFQKKIPLQAVGYPVKELLNNRYPTACGGRNVIPSGTVIPAKAGIQSSCQKKTPPQAVGYPVKELL